MNEAPRVFISYSHDSEPHKEWVKALGTEMRGRGIDIILDAWDLKLGQDVAMFMQKGISESDRVLMVCTERYVEKAEAGKGGVGYERLIVTAHVVQAIDTTKFIPLMRNNPRNKVPHFLGHRKYAAFNDDASFTKSLDELCNEVLGLAPSKPPLGNSFSSSRSSATPRAAGPTGRTSAGVALLDEEWFNQQASAALAGIAKVKLTGSMEIKFGLHDQINKSQIELLDAVRSAQIKTFGWPIAITLDKDEHRPVPVPNGVRAEVIIDKARSVLERDSYDYWALKNNGDFFLLQSLFEDTRKPDRIFFNTRIVRVTEALLFANALYTKLGVPPESLMSVRVTHRGLRGRKLDSSSPNRLLSLEPVCQSDEAVADGSFSLEAIRTDMPGEVERLLAPMFMLFDFQQINSAVYDDIVQRFVQGDVS